MLAVPRSHLEKIIIFFLSLFIFLEEFECAKVLVKIYDHRAYHDPKDMYGKGPWKYFEHGFGINYGYEPDGSKGHEKGYGFIKAYASEKCKSLKKCDPHFWENTSLGANGLSSVPYFGHPPADVVEPNTQSDNYIKDGQSPAWRDFYRGQITRKHMNK